MNPGGHAYDCFCDECCDVGVTYPNKENPPKLTRKQFAALERLQPTTIQCACITSSEREGVTLRMAKSLAAKGLVVVVPNASRRCNRVWITDAGHAALKDGGT